jgi:hypothetical protein
LFLKQALKAHPFPKINGWNKQISFDLTNLERKFLFFNLNSFFGILSINFMELHGGISTNAFVSQTGTQISPFLNINGWNKQISFDLTYSKWM